MIALSISSFFLPSTLHHCHLLLVDCIQLLGGIWNSNVCVAWQKKSLTSSLQISGPFLNSFRAALICCIFMVLLVDMDKLIDSICQLFKSLHLPATFFYFTACSLCLLCSKSPTTWLQMLDSYICCYHPWWGRRCIGIVFTSTRRHRTNIFKTINIWNILWIVNSFHIILVTASACLLICKLA